MNTTVSTIAKNLVNLFYPLHCAACKKALDPADAYGVCGPCIAGIRRNPRPYCAKCGRSVDDARRLCTECRREDRAFDLARGACLYDGVMKDLIGMFKYRHRVSLAPLFSKLMADFLAGDDILDGVEVLTFVPLHKRRLRQRGFNQSKVLAAYLAKEYSLPAVDLLEKTRMTRPQNELSREERLRNLEGAFAVKDASAARGRSILIVDDVMTTGATFDGCAAALGSAGARGVRCLALARGV